MHRHLHRYPCLLESQLQELACIRSLALPEDEKAWLLRLTPATYTGRASQLARHMRAVSWSMSAHLTHAIPADHTAFQQARVLDKNLWTPRLTARDIGLDKTETGPGGIKTVHIGVADMIVRLGLELGLYIVELVF